MDTIKISFDIYFGFNSGVYPFTYICICCIKESKSSKFPPVAFKNIVVCITVSGRGFTFKITLQLSIPTSILIALSVVCMYLSTLILVAIPALSEDICVTTSAYETLHEEVRYFNNGIET